MDSFADLNNVRQKNSSRLIIAQLNINSLRNKFDSFSQMVKDNVDILLISETKIDSSFPTAQFNMNGFTTYRRDRNINGGGITLYVREDIPSSLLKIDTSIAALYVEINVRKKKWLIGYSYNPHKGLIGKHLTEIGKDLGIFSANYDNFILLGDFNSEPKEQYVKDFCHVYKCKNIIIENTCFKNPDNPSCIDLFITNRPTCFNGSMTIETGLSDFHKMTISVMKIFYKKQRPNIIRYRNYKNFNNELFISDVEELTSKYNEPLKFESFKNIVDKILEKHALMKKRFVRANQAPFVNKKISKEIMKRSRLRNKFLHSKSDIDRKAYNKQRNICVTLIRQEKKNFYSNLNMRDVTDNKMFRKKVRPLFTDKIQTKSKITLIEKKVLKENGKVNEVEKIITDDKAIAEIFNEFYVNIVPNLKISMENNFDTEFVKTENPVLNAVNKYKNHPSVIMIKEKIKPIETFSFFPVQYDDVLRKIRNLDPSKSSQQTDIPTKILNYNSEYFAGYFHENIDFCFENSCLPSDLKFADVTPAYQKNSKNSKDNYRPVSILSNISKVYERCIYDQMEAYFETILSPNQRGFRKGFSAQHCSISLIEKWKKNIDNGGAFGALMTNLSKAFDCLSHQLLIAKLEAYGFDEKSLKLIYNYLSNRKQRVKINDSYSSWREILYGVPQGSILGP